jgi:bifunctional UDP-N-acetylglucosamine pyrophosphorylase/glucosamine-1-phosphate N-acetyltransferase
MTLSVAILAAGQGKRMHSKLPKVLHHLGGKALLEHVIHSAEALQLSLPPVVVYGHQGDMLKHALAHLNIIWAEQTEQLGTGHALKQALPHLADEHRVLVLYGDVPLISANTLKRFITETAPSAIGIITANVSDPTGLGRIIRDDQGHIIDIIEEKDLSLHQKDLSEINTGIYLFPAGYLSKTLSHLKNNNAQKEYYLTDVIKMAVQDKLSINSMLAPCPNEITGVNNRMQLAKLERAYQLQIADKLMDQGVTLRDPARFDVRGDLTVGADVVIDINVICEGRVIIGNQCTIGPNTVLRNVILGDNVEIKANSVIDGAEIGNGCIIGPFARIRPGTILADLAHVGNFVEIKNSIIKEGSKVNHLSYIGDSEVGKKVNIGAGTITCNYDGVNKHKTTIGDNAFIGSNTCLVAPVMIGEGAYIATSSTITRNAPPHQLTICRARDQRSIENWKKPKKKEQ